MAALTCGVGELVLLALYAVLQCLGIPAGNLYSLLDIFRVRVRHADCARETGSMAVAVLRK